jgi:hypothetical protein
VGGETAVLAGTMPVAACRANPAKAARRARLLWCGTVGLVDLPAKQFTIPALFAGRALMAKQFSQLETAHRDFIARQHIFFVASAAADSRINLSPKGHDCLRVLDENRACYLDLTGSGSETSAHLLADGRLTFMFCAFDGPPLILRLYGRGRSLVRGSAEYAAMLAQAFDGEELAGARQIVVLDIDLVQTSCGYAVPLYEHQEQRPTLVRWAESKGEDGLTAYRQEKNRVSLDGLPTGILAEPVADIVH